MNLAAAQQQPTEYERATAYACAKPSVAAPGMARDLGIAASVARSFLAQMVTEKLISPANDIGRHLVLNSLTTAAVIAITPEVARIAAAHGINDADAVAQVASDYVVDHINDRDVITPAAGGRLRTIVERIERLEEDKAVIGNDLKEVYAEAKGEGFNAKILRKVVRLRKTDKVRRDEEEALIDLYLSAIGGL